MQGSTRRCGWTAARGRPDRPARGHVKYARSSPKHPDPSRAPYRARSTRPRAARSNHPRATRHRRVLAGRQPRRGGDECADRNGERERADPGVFFPAILLAGRSGSRDEPDGGSDHPRGAGQLCLAQLAQLGGQQHREGRFVQLRSGPERLAGGKVVLRPAPVLTFASPPDAPRMWRASRSCSAASSAKAVSVRRVAIPGGSRRECLNYCPRVHSRLATTAPG